MSWKQAPHPRLFLNHQRIAQLRAGLQTTYAPMWVAIEKQADAVAAKHPPAYSSGTDLSGEEQWWEMNVGSSLPYLALAYKITGKKVYLDAAKESRDISEYSYKRGAASLLDYLDAERSYRATELAYRQSLAAYLTAVEQLREAVGVRSLP